MKRILFILIIIFSFTDCAKKAKSSMIEEIMAIFLVQPSSFQVSATITNGTAPVANAMVYFSKASTTSIASSIRATATDTSTGTGTGTSADLGTVFETSAQTDENGNITFTLTVGEYQAIITTTDNKSQAFKIKIEPDMFSLNKEGKATITYADGTVKVVIIAATGLLSGGTPSPAISFVCGYNPLGDTAAPEITSVELSANTLDLTSGTGKVTIKAKLAEGNEGKSDAKKASGIKNVYAKLFSPKRITGGGSTAHAILTLNPATEMYEGDATLPNYVENGTWKVGIVGSRDNAGNEREYIFDTSKSPKNYSFNGCGQKIDSKILVPSLEVTGSSPDTEAPVLDTASLVLKSVVTGGATQNPITTDIDLSTSTATLKEVEITITINATDGGGTGIASGVGYIDARLQSYSWYTPGSNYLGNAIYVRLGNTTGSTYSGIATIRSYAEGNTTADGLWKLGGIWITDKAGNSSWTSRDTLNKSFTIINASTTAQADFYPPELKSITVDPKEVNFDESFKISAEVEDIASVTTSADQNTAGTGTNTGTGTDTSTGTNTGTGTGTATTTNNPTPSGVKSVTVTLYSPLKQLDSSLGQTRSVTLTLNTSTGKYEGTDSIPSIQEGGVWKVGYIEVSDKAGNSRVYQVTDGYSYYTYIKLSKIDGDITNSFNVTNIIPGSITRK